jgi:sorbose reductase
MFELRGRCYIVTGGAQGIGFASTRSICELGGNVAVLDIQEPVAEFKSLSTEFGVKTFFIQTDVTSQESLEAGFAEAVRQLGRLDGLVPAAGIAIDKPFIDQTWNEFSRIQEINGRGVFFSCQLTAKQMIKQGSGGSMVLLGESARATVWSCVCCLPPTSAN